MARFGLAVETACSYFKEIAFPDRIFVGLRVARMGRTSVRFEVALFRNDDVLAAAQGHFVHVYVDRGTRRPVELPAVLHESLAALVTIPLRIAGSARLYGLDGH